MTDTFYDFQSHPKVKKWELRAQIGQMEDEMSLLRQRVREAEAWVDASKGKLTQLLDRIEGCAEAFDYAQHHDHFMDCAIFEARLDELVWVRDALF